MIDIQINGEQELNARLNKIADAKWFDPFIKDLAQSVFDDIEQQYGKHSKTGMLEKSLGSGVEQLADHQYRVRSDGQIAPYNLFIEFGTRPHKIYPKDRKALRWVGGNGFIFAKFVNHPGTTGDPIFSTATDNVLQKFSEIAAKYMKDI
jgi:hypothetical protein